MTTPAALSLDQIIAQVARETYVDVELEPDGLLTARVYELGAAHVQSFTGKIMTFASALHGAQQDGSDTFGAISGVMLNECFVLLRETVKLGQVVGNTDEIEEVAEGSKALLHPGVPHWYLPKILRAWVYLSFGTAEKFGPWLHAIESLVQLATGDKEFSLGKQDWGTLFGQGSTSTTSADGETTDSHTEGGAGSSTPSPAAPSPSQPSTSLPSTQTPFEPGPQP